MSKVSFFCLCFLSGSFLSGMKLKSRIQRSSSRIRTCLLSNMDLSMKVKTINEILYEPLSESSNQIDVIDYKSKNNLLQTVFFVLAQKHKHELIKYQKALFDVIFDHATLKTFNHKNRDNLSVFDISVNLWGAGSLREKFLMYVLPKMSARNMLLKFQQSEKEKLAFKKNMDDVARSDRNLVVQEDKKHYVANLQIPEYHDHVIMWYAYPFQLHIYYVPFYGSY